MERLFRLSLQALLLLQTSCQITPEPTSPGTNEEVPFTISNNGYNSYRIETYLNKYSQLYLNDGVDLIKKHCGFVHSKRTKMDRAREFASVVVFVIKENCYTPKS